MPKYIRYYISKSCKDGTLLTVSATYGNRIHRSCKDDRCITVSVAERNLRRQEKDNVALAGLSSSVSVYTVSGTAPSTLLRARLAYGYAHSTPAALKFAGEFTDNQKE